MAGTVYNALVVKIFSYGLINGSYSVHLDLCSMLSQLLLRAVHMSLEAIIQGAPEQLRQGLSWFAANAGKTVKWSEAGKAETRLFSTPKGIYKPEGSKFALSVRQTLKTAYPDRAPQFRPDGTWTYLYHQEGETPEADGLFTNKGLRACMEEGVPVGVARQVSAKPDTRYAILGLARVTHWKDGVFQLDGYAHDGTLFSQSVDGPLATVLLATEPQVEPFDPASQEDARQRVLSSVVRRRGQSKFRAGCYVPMAANARLPVVLLRRYWKPHMSPPIWGQIQMH